MKLQNKRCENKNVKRAAPNAQTEHPPKTQNIQNAQEGGGAEEIQSEGWRTRPAKRKKFSIMEQRWAWTMEQMPLIPDVCSASAYAITN